MTVIAPRTITTRPRTSDRVYRGIVTAGGMASLAILGLITVFLWANSKDVFARFGLNFITDVAWVADNVDAGEPGRFGIGAMLAGTVVTSMLALIVALPVSVGLALFLTQYAPVWINRPLTVLVDLMAAYSFSLSLPW